VAFQPVSLTATVAAAGAGPGAPTPGGAVTFLDGAAVLGTAPLEGGVARLAVSTLAVGAHALGASFPGDVAYLGATAAAFPHEVAAGATTVALTTSPALPVSGQPLTLTADVTRSPDFPGAPAPAGTVTFFDGPEPIGQVALAAGQASLLVSGLPVGGHVFTAVYGGDATSAPATSTGQPLVVDLASTATALTSSPSPSFSGQAVTFTASVSVLAPGAGAVTGGVTFLDGATVLGTVAVSGSAASLTTAALAVGTHAVTARYGGGAGLAGSTSPAVSQVVKSPLYAFTGFLSPLAAAGTLASPSVSGSQNFGSAVPLKWQLRDASGALVSRLSSTTLVKAVLNTACKGPAPAGAKELILYSPTAGATGGSTFRFSTDQFVFTWDTSKGATKGCWEIVLTLDDGSPARATIVPLK
jgi:hypothetical protein